MVPSFSCGIRSINWVVATVDKHIIAFKALPCSHICIRIDETSGFSVVVARLEVVQLRLGIIDIPSIPERIQSADGASLATGEGCGITPCIVGVLDDGVQVAVGEADDVALGVVEVVVGSIAVGRGVADEAFSSAGGVVHEDQCVPTLLHGMDGAAVVYHVLGGHVAYRLADADAVGVVAVGDGGAVGQSCGGQLAALLPCEGHAPVAQGVANGIVGNGLTVVGGQQVLPCAVAVGIGHRLPGSGLAEDVAPGVIGVSGSLSRDRVHILRQPVHGVIGIASDPAGCTVGFRDGGDVAVGIVGVGKARIAPGTGLGTVTLCRVRRFMLS